MFELFPESTVFPSVSPETIKPAAFSERSQEISKTTKKPEIFHSRSNPADKSEDKSEDSESIATTPIVQMIRLEVSRPRQPRHRLYQLPYQLPLRYPAKSQDSRLPQPNEATPVVSVSATPESNCRLFESERTVEPLSKPDTLPFPLRESLPDSITSESSTPKLATPEHPNETWRLIWQSHWPEHLKSLERAASDQICFLADHLEIQKEQGRTVLSFNGFYSGDGCTTLALCAARELAERGYRLLLVDAHRQNPELPQLLHLKTNPDFYEIITLIPERLELLPWSETAIEISNNNQTTTQSFSEIVGSFRADYDFILLDNGSLTECPFSERMILWREMGSDGVLLVLNMKNPVPVNIRGIAQRLLQNQVNLLGIVENYV
ncbi:MAG: hypothetical protein LBQ50_05200 [Planctomycetaceae bacterium]|nr:hypothetical protein [Planctomycetaceae bacterium]